MQPALIVPEEVSSRPRKRLPLRIPHPLGGCGFREAPGRGVVARTHDRRLVLWDDPKRGPIELADHTPAGALRAFRISFALVLRLL